MALGSNRDYVKTHRIIKKNLLNKYPVEMWECPNYNRKQYPGQKECPRCKTSKPE